MVRTEVDDEIVVVKETVLSLCEVSELVKVVFRCPICLRLIRHGELVGLGTHIKIFTKRVALEVAAHKETAHVRMSKELDAQEVEDLTL